MQMKNLVDSILNFDLVKNIWNWKFLSLKKKFTKDFLGLI
jgi:hypothetical protein